MILLLGFTHYLALLVAEFEMEFFYCVITLNPLLHCMYGYNASKIAKNLIEVLYF